MLKTAWFDEWLACLRDRQTRFRIVRRIERAQTGNFGDHKNVDGPIWEMRIDCGPGYRVYYARKADTVYLLLGGGDKSSQTADIRFARKLWEGINGGEEKD